MAAVLTITMSMLCQGRSYQCEAHSLSLPMLSLHQEPIHTRFLAQRSGLNPDHHHMSAHTAYQIVSALFAISALIRLKTMLSCELSAQLPLTRKSGPQSDLICSPPTFCMLVHLAHLLRPSVCSDLVSTDPISVISVMEISTQ
jgi:hypothetical protein